MNQDQVMSLLRAILMFIGNMLVAQGVLTASNSTTLQSGIITIVGAAVTVAPIVWGIIAHTKTNMIKSVNAADNGVKVVANGAVNASVPTVNEALK